MANFKKAVLTKQGSNLLARCQAGQTTIKFTRAVIGSGEYSSTDNLIEAMRLKAIKQEVAYSVIEVVDDSIVYLGLTITNTPKDKPPLDNGYYITEVGLYAEDSEHNEVLYAIAIAESGQADYLPAYNGIAPSTVVMRFYLQATSDSPISIIVDSETHATAEDLNATNMLIQGVQLDTRIAKRFAETHNTDIESHQDIRELMHDMATKEQLSNAISATETKLTTDINAKDEVNTTAHNDLQRALDDKADVDYVDAVRNEITDDINSIDEVNNLLCDELRRKLDEKANTTYVDTKVASLVDSAPETLDTLKELSEALGNDPNFATTVANEIGKKANASHTHDDLEYNVSTLFDEVGQKASKGYVDDAINELSIADETISQAIDNLQEAVDNKADIGHGHSLDDISGLDGLSVDGGNADTLDGKHASDFAAANHTHTLQSIGLQQVASGSNVNDFWDTGTFVNNNWTGDLPTGILDSQGILVCKKYIGVESSFWTHQIFISPHCATRWERCAGAGNWSNWSKIINSDEYNYKIITGDNIDFNNLYKDGHVVIYSIQCNTATASNMPALCWGTLISSCSQREFRYQIYFQDDGNTVWGRRTDGAWQKLNERVNGVKFNPGQLLTSNGNPQYFYAFNSSDDCNCYVKPLSELAFANHIHDGLFTKFDILPGSFLDTLAGNFYGRIVSSNLTSTSHLMFQFDLDPFRVQISFDLNGNGLYVRTKNAVGWSGWKYTTLNAVNW